MTHASTPSQHNHFLTGIINTKLIEIVKKLSLTPSFILGINLLESAITELSHLHHQAFIANISLENLIQNKHDFQEGYFDTVVANLAVNENIDLDLLFSQIEKIIKVDGLLIFITYDHASQAALKQSINAEYYTDEKNLTKNANMQENFEFEAHKIHLLKTDDAQHCIDGQIVLMVNKRRIKPFDKLLRIPLPLNEDESSPRKKEMKSENEPEHEAAEVETEAPEKPEAEEETEDKQREILEAMELQKMNNEKAQMLQEQNKKTNENIEIQNKLREMNESDQEKKVEDLEAFMLLQELNEQAALQKEANLEQLREREMEKQEASENEHGEVPEMQEQPEREPSEAAEMPEEEMPEEEATEEHAASEHNELTEQAGSENLEERAGLENAEEPESPEEQAEPQTPEEQAEPENPEEQAESQTPEEQAEPESPEEQAESQSPEEQAESQNPEEQAEPESPEEQAEPESPEEQAESQTPEEQATSQNSKQQPKPQSSAINHTNIIESLTHLETNLASQAAALHAQMTAHPNSSTSILEALGAENLDATAEKAKKSSLLAAYHQNIASHKDLLSTLIKLQENVLNPELNAAIENHKKILKTHEEQAQKLKANLEPPTLKL